MIAAAVTLALFGFMLTFVIDVMRRDGAKISAAIHGRSWTSGPTAGRPVTIRFSSPETICLKPLPRPELRAAA